MPKAVDKADELLSAIKEPEKKIFKKLSPGVCNYSYLEGGGVIYQSVYCRSLLGTS